MKHKPLLIGAVVVALVALILVVVYVLQKSGATQEREALQKTKADKRTAALQNLGVLSQTIDDHKKDLRLARVPADQVRAKLQEIIHEIDRHFETWPRDPRGYFLRAKARFVLEDLPSAMSDLSVALEIDPACRCAGNLVCQIKFEDMVFGQFLTGERRAVVVNEKLAKLADLPESAEWGVISTPQDDVAKWLAKSLVLIGRDGPAGAVAMLKRAFEGSQAEEYALYIGGVGREADSVSWLDRAVTLAPGFLPAWMARAERRLASGDFAGAKADYDEAIKLRPLPAAHLSRGKAKMGLKDPSGALTDFEKYVRLRDADPEGYFNRGNAKSALKEVPGAVADYSRAIELKADYAAAFLNRGLLKLEFNDLDVAMADLTKSIELKPEILAYNNRAVLKMMKDDGPGAMEDFEKSLELTQENPNALLGRAQVKIRSGKRAEAIPDLEKALEVAPADWIHRSNAQGLLESTKKLIK